MSLSAFSFIWADITCFNDQYYALGCFFLYIASQGERRRLDLIKLCIFSGTMSFLKLFFCILIFISFYVPMRQRIYVSVRVMNVEWFRVSLKPPFCWSVTICTEIIGHRKILCTEKLGLYIHPTILNLSFKTRYFKGTLAGERIWDLLFATYFLSLKQYLRPLY